MPADYRDRQVGESYKDYAARMAGMARAAERDRDVARARVAALKSAIQPVRRAWDSSDLITTPEGHEHLNALCVVLDGLDEIQP